MEKLLSLCEHEQLHLTGAIQPHGVLIYANAAGVITHCSANVESLVGVAPKALLGQPLQAVFGEVVMPINEDNRCVYTERAREFNGYLDFCINMSDSGDYSIEIYPHFASDNKNNKEVQLCEMPQHEYQITQQRNELLEEVAKMTGFKRIMYYQFVENNDGEVVAEFCHSSVDGSYLKLRFPASDIPQIARDLYIKNPWRMIPDAAADAIAVLSFEQAAPDLTYCDLRSVSPMHKIYLANMGVHASLSFPVVVNGNLIALVACHDNKRNIVPYAMLEACRSLVSRFSMSLSAYTAYQRMCLVDGLNSRFKPIQLLLQRNGSLVDSWQELAPWILQELNVSGVVVIHDNKILRHGLTLEDSALSIVEQEFINSSELIWSKDCLSRQLSSFVLSEVAGVMATKIGSDLKNMTRVYLCQQEQIQEIAWGGNPDKPVEFHDGKLGISPRRSFAKWIEKRVGYSCPWDNRSRLLLLKLRELLSGTVYG